MNYTWDMTKIVVVLQVHLKIKTILEWFRGKWSHIYWWLMNGLFSIPYHCIFSMRILRELLMLWMEENGRGVSTKMMEGGQNRREIFIFCCRAPTRARSPDLLHAKRKPTGGKPRQSATPPHSILRAVYIFGWLRHKKLNEHAPTACWILLDMGGLGL